MLRRLVVIALLALAVGAVAVAPSSMRGLHDIRPAKTPHAYAYRNGQCVDDGPSVTFDADHDTGVYFDGRGCRLVRDGVDDGPCVGSPTPTEN